jgi:energy-coupling factor transporter ATP-binding protein EcfA2
MDFYQIYTREVQKTKDIEIYPDFKVGRSKDLMVRGRSFYAIWDEEAGLWSTDEYSVARIVDADLKIAADRFYSDTGIWPTVKYMNSFGSGSWAQFRRFLLNVSDNSTQLDENLTFANQKVRKEDYVSRRLPYALEAGDFSAWDELVGTLYSVEERAKIEWAIGAVISGDSKKIQKFLVLYGPAGTGKSTVLNVIQKLFPGYITSFEAKALGSNGSSFSTEVFKSNPLVAVQHDGDLSRIDDNTRLNSIIAHEEMTMNEKYKPSYTAKVNAFLFMGTNQPVKISDAKSGIIRRLIDVHPTGVRIPANHYYTLMSRIDFELGAIANHCLDVYRSMGKNYYERYRPLEMMLQTDVFFNFIEWNYDIFRDQDYTTLKQAYALYKEFCSETGIERVMPQYKFREELRNYFDEFKERGTLDEQVVRSIYTGFNANRFKAPVKEANAYSLTMDESESLFDQMAADWPAQYEVYDEEAQQYRPQYTWAKCKTTLKDLDTSKVHFVKVPENHIVIDFDLKEANGEKSLERNLEAASVWQPTYAELSKSGSGVHLHYEYPGDVSQLALLYSDGIEIKTLLGDGALRRRFSRGNNIPVASLNRTLPAREKKVLNDQVIKTEKGLRDLIARNLRKEVHPGTKSSIDFIHHILEEAYASGMPYDVSDLKGKVFAFANNSTNQAMYCIKKTQDMKWKAEETVESPPATPISDDREVYWDVEVYPNLFVVCWKFEDDPVKQKMINPTPEQLEPLFKLKLVGFYNRRYDNHILWAAYLGYNNQQLFELSQKLIVDNNRDAYFGEAYNLSYADVYDYAATKMTLKKWMIFLGIKHVELPFPWDKPIDQKYWDLVVEYCCNDVDATEAVAKHLKGDFMARQILAELSGLSVNDTTAKHTAKIIFNGDRNPQQDFVYTHLSEEFPGYVYERGVSTYRGEIVGEGGYVYAEPGIYENVTVLDITSMHPTTIERLNLFGPYTKNFSALKDARVAIKKRDFETAKGLLNGKLAPFLENEEQAEALAYALKIVINTVYGLTAARFDNPFKDIRNKDNIVAKRGALFMVELKHACQEKGLQVIHIKTDSIKIPNASPEDVEEIMAFGERYGYTFEDDGIYDVMCLVNDAVYIAKKALGGGWEAVGAQFQHPYVFKTLFTGEQIEFKDLCEPRSVVKGAMYLDFEFDKPEPLVEGMHFIGKTGVFVPVTQESGGAVLYRVADERLFAVAGTKGHLWMEAEMAKSKIEAGEAQIDMSYFEKLAEDARATIGKFGDYERFVS